MLSVKLDKNRGIAVLEPNGALSKKDFDRAAGVIDPYLEHAARLNGLVIHAKRFPGWASLKDPAKLFNSSLDGNVRRAIDIHEGEAVDGGAFKTLIRAAVALNISGGKAPPRRAKEATGVAPSLDQGDSPRAPHRLRTSSYDRSRSPDRTTTKVRKAKAD
jgi:hypothetical protein